MVGLWCGRTRWINRSLFSLIKAIYTVAEKDVFNSRVSEELKVLFNFEVKLKINLFGYQGLCFTLKEGNHIQITYTL